MNRIKKLREELVLTQQDLADKLNCSKSVIGLYESETRKPSLEVLVKLSEIFDSSIDYILGKSDIRKPEQHIKDEFSFAYHKETEGLSEDEIIDAIKAYKEIIKKYKNNNGDKK